jgi:hypothetical protein
MKQVVTVIPEKSYIQPYQVSTNKYYGFTLDSDSPGFILADDMVDNPYSYQAKFLHNMTRGNSWCDKFSTLEACVKNLINEGAEVYEFDTYQELLKWSSEQ